MFDYGGIDWALLREQKQDLLEIITFLEHQPGTESKYYQKKIESLTGILHLIDAIQDEAVDSGDYTEEEIFNLNEDPDLSYGGTD